MSDALIDLIARLDDATEPSRVIDAEIAALDDPHERFPTSSHPVGWLVGGTADQPLEAPRFTGSIDAALLLVPTVHRESDRKSWALDLSPSSSLYHAAVYCNHGWRHARGATPAIALCLAALRARLHCIPVPHGSRSSHSAD